MAQQIRDAQISVRLDTEKAFKQSKQLASKVRENKVEMAGTKKEYQQLDRDVKRAKGEAVKPGPFQKTRDRMAKINATTGLILDKARNYGYRGVTQLPDLTTGGVRAVTAFVGAIPVIGSLFARGLEGSAPIAPLLSDISHGATDPSIQDLLESQIPKGASEEQKKMLKEEIRKALDDALPDGVDSWADYIRYLRKTQAALGGTVSGLGKMFGATALTGMDQSDEFWGTALEAEWEIAGAQAGLDIHVKSLQRQWMSKNVKAMLMEKVNPFK
tara:strand:- start:6160 stop:6975 length:816 start_codon:yes stop_codon:yes gene_type:complete